MVFPTITASVLPDKRAILSCSLMFARTCSTSNVCGIMRTWKKETTTIKKEVYVCGLYVERTEADHAAITYKYLWSPPLRSFCVEPMFRWTFGHYFPEFRHAEISNDALTAETPRLGGASPHLPNSPIRAHNPTLVTSQQSR